MGIGYKLFRAKKEKENGKEKTVLYPLYVLASQPLEMGAWLEAECGERLENGKVKSRLGPLAYRPGWHINDETPYVEHIYTLHDGRKYQKDGTVWCEVEYSDDINYQAEAEKAGTNAKGKVTERNAFLHYIPENGYYRYKTSPQMYGTWIIAGKMKIIKIISEKEVRELCRKKGLEPLPVWKEK